MRFIRTVTWLVALWSTICGCSVLIDTAGLGGGTPDVPRDATFLDATPSDATPSDASTDVRIEPSPVDAADAAPADSGLIGEWLFDDTSTAATDTSGRGNHGRYVGAITIAGDGGVRGGAMTTAANGDGVIVDALGLAAFPRSGTLAMWLRGEGPPPGSGSDDVFDRWQAGRSHLFCRRLPDPGVTIQCALQSSPGSDGGYPWFGVATISVGQWVHLTVTWDTTLKECALFINGKETVRKAIADGVYPSEQIVRVGGMSGRYDEIRLYDRPLTVLEVATLP